jgi:hypothetical protein
MAVRDLPYRGLHPLIRDHLSLTEDLSTATLIDRLRPVRRRGYLTKRELEAVCRWKSPRAIGWIRLNARNRIRQATSVAWAAKEERERLEALIDLQGVSVPMASAILTLVNPKRYGVIDIRVWQLLHRLGAVAGNPAGTHFTFTQWERFLILIRHFAGVFGVPARDIERTLFLVHRKYQDGRLYGPQGSPRAVRPRHNP